VVHIVIYAHALLIHPLRYFYISIYRTPAAFEDVATSRRPVEGALDIYRLEYTSTTTDETTFCLWLGRRAGIRKNAYIGTYLRMYPADGRTCVHS